MARDSCLERVTSGVAIGGAVGGAVDTQQLYCYNSATVVSKFSITAVGGAVGGAVGAVYGTYEAVRFKVPGFLKIRYIGQTTLGSAAIFGLFLGAGSLIHCGKSY